MNDRATYKALMRERFGATADTARERFRPAPAPVAPIPLVRRGYLLFQEMRAGSSE